MPIPKKNNPWFFENFFGSHWLVLSALSLACLIAYANSFRNHFMLDDNIILFGQRGVLNKSLWGIFASDQGNFYRPVGHLPLWFFSHILGSSYIGYHALNFLLFVSIVFLFFIIVRKITSDPLLSFLSALLYAMHPLNAMIINYITASVLAVFVLSMQLSFLFFMYFAERGQKRDYIFSLIFFILACFSHEMAMMLPLYLAVYLSFIKKQGGEKIFQILSFFVLYLIVWAAFRSQYSFFPHQFDKRIFETGHFVPSFSTWMDLMIWHVSNLFFPSRVIFLWSTQYSQEHLWRNVIVFMVAFSLGTYALFQWKKSWKSLLLMIFVLGYFPTILSCFPDFPECRPMIEPHWFYFSEIGFFVLAAWFLLTMAHKYLVIGRILAGGVILSLLICCWHYNSEWQSQEKYSRYWLSLNEGNLTPYYGLGRSLMDKGDYRGAKYYFLLAFKRLNYWSLEMSADLGHCDDMLGDDKDALFWLERSIKWSNQYALTYHYLGLYYNRRGDFIEAQKDFKKAVEIDPKFSPSRAYLKTAN